jgi:hypothetical protein
VVVCWPIVVACWPIVVVCAVSFVYMFTRTNASRHLFVNALTLSTIVIDYLDTNHLTSNCVSTSTCKNFDLVILYVSAKTNLKINNKSDDVSPRKKNKKYQSACVCVESAFLSLSSLLKFVHVSLSLVYWKLPSFRSLFFTEI